MKISEIFYSIQGEGKLVGVPSVFIRTSGCNLRCTWCDTPYTSWSPEGEEISIASVLDAVSKYECRHVVVTGGEPLIAEGVAELTQRLRERGYHITIETAATVWADVACDLASISPKLASSTPWEREGGRFAAAHEKQRINVDTIRRCMALGDHQLKFVIDRAEDLAEIDALLAAIGDPGLAPGTLRQAPEALRHAGALRPTTEAAKSALGVVVEPSNVLLMPQGVTREELESRAVMVAEMCKRRGFRYCPRLHIELFGNRRGT